MGYNKIVLKSFVQQIRKGDFMKRTLFIVFATCSILATTSFNVYANWEAAGSNWIYKENDGSIVKNEWRKGVDGKYRWLNSDGFMEVDSWVNSGESYVDKDGIRVENTWLKVTSDNTTDWYHFDNKGIKEVSKWRKANDKWFYLGDDGKMLRGWIDDGTYYCDENGVMVTGWKYLTPVDYVPKDDTAPGNESIDGNVWYFFGANGKKFVASKSGGVEEYKINGIRYCFDETGAMLTGWVNIAGTSSSVAKITDFRYYNEDGSQRTGWYSLRPPARIMETYDNEVEWFYFGTDGIPKASSKDRLKVNDFVKISGRTYIFGSNGVPIYGMIKVYTSGDNYDIYYLGDTTQRNVQKGKFNIVESSGDTIEYYFETSGRGLTGVKDDKLYYKGRLQTSQDEGKYKIVTISDGSKTRNYVVTKTGKIVKNRTFKNEDKVELKTDSSGVLIKYDGNAVEQNARFSEPDEPEIG